jgi:uncharacterized protein YndB with AHSA1/START domain
MTNGSFNVSTPGDHEIVLTRVFNAPRRMVFDAYTKPELVKRWLLGPDGWSMPICDIDLRVGGQYRYGWRSDADGTEFGFKGEFQEIRPAERIVHTERPAEDETAEAALVTTTWVEQHGKTTVTQTMRVGSREVRDAIVATGMADGVAVSYDRLDGLLASLQAKA